MEQLYKPIVCSESESPFMADGSWDFLIGDGNLAIDECAGTIFRPAKSADFPFPQVVDTGIDFLLGEASQRWFGQLKMPSESALEVSGRSLHNVAHELAHWRLRQEQVRVWIDSSAWCQIIGPRKCADEVTDEDVCFDSSFYDSPLISHCINWKQLAEKLKKLSIIAAKIAKRISKLSRRIKAIKRAMRQRHRVVFCGLDQEKKVWFLLHGSHPPKDISATTVDVLVGRAWI